MRVHILTDAEYCTLERMYRGLLSSKEASELLERALTRRCDWSDQHRCIDGAVRGGYVALARDAILAGENRELISILDTIEREIAQSRTGK